MLIFQFDAWVSPFGRFFLLWGTEKPLVFFVLFFFFFFFFSEKPKGLPSKKRPMYVPRQFQVPTANQYSQQSTFTDIYCSKGVTWVTLAKIQFAHLGYLPKSNVIGGHNNFNRGSGIAMHV